LLIITAGWTAGLMSQIQWMKKAIILAVPLDVSIQATGMPNPERSALSAGTLEINFTYYGPTCP
jgi:hypothetical protein